MRRASRMRMGAAAAAWCAVAWWAGMAGAAPEKAAGGIRFTYEDANAAQVHWAGEFNGWNATANPMTRGADGVWTITLPLGVGEHQYKFVVDGQWVADPENAATAGEFGNSVVAVGPDGDLIRMQAASNTPYSAKIFIGGRTIGLYNAIRNPATRRFELNRPNLDVDLDFGIRMSDFLRARFLVNINSEQENVDFFRTRLNFDRGYLDFRKPDFQIFAYDNEDAGTWDDPLHLVGDNGIYHHAYGFERQGFRFRSNKWKFDSELHYADNFRTGGTTFPPLAGDASAQAIAQLRTRPSGSGYVLDPDPRGLVQGVLRSDANEDMLALRVRRQVLDTPEAGRLRLGVLGRTDRGFNLGALATAKPSGPDRFEVVQGNFQQVWYAFGGEAQWLAPWNLEVAAEALRGRHAIDMLGGSTISHYTVAAADSEGVQSSSLDSVEDGFGRDFVLDTSDRYKLSATWREAHGDVVVTGSVEYQDHVYGFDRAGLDNSMVVYGLDWDRNWRYYLNREVRTGLGVEYVDFQYDADTPWEFQLWFPTGNFWLEHGEHRVDFGRLTLLGGNDVVSLRPRLEVPIYVPRNFTFRYDGTFHTVSLDRRPKYVESLFRLGYDLSEALRLSSDTRWAKYDDPVLGLDQGYVNHFVELAYRFSPQTQIAISYGVDPWVIDPPVNEYAYIGRDLFLFDRGANGANAESNFFGLGSRIAAAEKALRDDRRIQIEAIVRF